MKNITQNPSAAAILGQGREAVLNFVYSVLRLIQSGLADDKKKILKVDREKQCVEISRRSKTVSFFFESIYWNASEVVDASQSEAEEDPNRLPTTLEEIRNTKIGKIEALLSEVIFGQTSGIKWDANDWRFARMVYYTACTYCKIDDFNKSIVLEKLRCNANFDLQKIKPEEQGIEMLMKTWQAFNKFLNGTVEIPAQSNGKKLKMFDGDIKKQASQKKAVTKYLEDNRLTNKEWKKEVDNPINAVAKGFVEAWKKADFLDQDYKANADLVHFFAYCGIPVKIDDVRKNTLKLVSTPTIDQEMQEEIDNLVVQYKD